MIRPTGRHPGYLAFLLHRLSGLALVVFLPLHFAALGLALNDAAALEGFIRWTDNPWVKAGEWGLVMLLSLHLAGGLRLLAIEFLPWSARQQSWIAAGVAASAGTGLLFLLNLL